MQPLILRNPEGEKSKAPLRLDQAISAWKLGPHHLLGLRSLETCNLGQGENIGGKKKKINLGTGLNPFDQLDQATTNPAVSLNKPHSSYHSPKYLLVQYIVPKHNSSCKFTFLLAGAHVTLDCSQQALPCPSN